LPQPFAEESDVAVQNRDPGTLRLRYAITGARSATTTNTAYLYEVLAVDGGGNVSLPSNIDLATTIVFKDDPIIAGSTVIQAIHLVELRTAVNAVRAAAGLTSTAFTDSAPSGVVIKTIHISGLRSSLDAARAAIGLPMNVYTDAILTPGVTVTKTAHIQELRDGVE
jgi:hypothetical protein